MRFTLLFGELEKIDFIIKVLELVDMTMVAQSVWVVALAGVSPFVTTVLTANWQQPAPAGRPL